MDVGKAQVGDMRTHHQHAAHADHDSMAHIAVINIEQDPEQQQDHAGNHEHKCGGATMATEPKHQRSDRKRHGKPNKGALKGVVGEERQAQCRQSRNHNRQQCAVQSTKEGRRRTEAVGQRA